MNNIANMDLTETFIPSQEVGVSENNETSSNFFEFVVCPPTRNDEAVDENGFLQRSNCPNTLSFLSDEHMDHDGYVKETNNNVITATALPPVSTITGGPGHIISLNNRNHLISNDAMVIDQPDDCQYWVSEDTKDQTCNILLEDLNKYCWSTQTIGTNDQHQSGLLIQRRDAVLNDGIQVPQPTSNVSTGPNPRQNTDGAIYTLTVLNSEASSMDGGSPNASSVVDGWTVRPNHLDFDEILNMDSGNNMADQGNVVDVSSSTNGHQTHEPMQIVVTSNGEVFTTTPITTFAAIPTENQTQQASSSTQFIKQEPMNNNEWKITDRSNNMQEQQVTQSAAESLLRNALQGKLYPTVITASNLDTTAVRLLDSQTVQEESLSNELMISQLTNVDGSFRTMTNEVGQVVEPFSIEPNVCNVTGTTVMYTLDPTNGSLLMVTTSSPQQEILPESTDSLQGTQIQQQNPSANQTQVTASSGTSRSTGTKPKKPYVRRPKVSKVAAAQRINANSEGTAGPNGLNTAGNSGSVSTDNSGASQSNVAVPGSSGVVPQRKERSLHFCGVCNKGFKDKYSVNVHIRTHTGEKPFQCRVCKKNFRQKAHLAKHHQTHVSKESNTTAGPANVTPEESTSVKVEIKTEEPTSVPVVTTICPVEEIIEAVVSAKTKDEQDECIVKIESEKQPSHRQIILKYAVHIHKRKSGIV